ncbi:MAG: carboxypeptidase regulatory-like domain-containing protein [Pyrinomonadaceae bacterium]
MFYRQLLQAACALALVSLCVFSARASGGDIAGTVTDPMGAVVSGAQVTATDAATQKSATATTDAQGRYKISSLPAGTYVVAVTAQGFAETRQEGVRVEDGKTATANVQMRLPAVEGGSVNVSAKPGKVGGGDETYQLLRHQAASPAEFTSVAAVNNLVLKRDAATFTLKSGELYFLAPVEDRTVGAVFVGEGEFALTPPIDCEKHSLSIFTGEPSITEQFTKLTLRFTDKTFEEVKASPNVKLASGGADAQHARDIFHDNESLLRKELRTNMELRTLVDLHTPERPGFFIAFINGKRFEKLIFQIDPLGIPEVSPEEVLLASYGETDGGYWTAFHLADQYRTGKASSSEEHRIYDITHHEIDGAISGTKIAANDIVTFRVLQPGARVLPFDLFPSLRVARVRDEQGRELTFVQEGKDRDADFGVIYPEPLEAGKTYKLTVEYAGGDALSDLGGGNFYLGPRLTWYPNNYGTQFGDRATFNVTMRYPSGKMFVGTGAPSAPDGRDGDIAVARWSSGETELAVAGFNYGRFKKKEQLDSDTGYQIEFYANEDLPNFMRGAAQVGSMSTTGMADTAIADAENSTRIYNAYFGKLPYKRLAMTQQPAGNFGQAWPTLVYMPFTAFMDSTQRFMATGSAQFAGDDFWRYVGPHEIAHQWWGHTVGWKSYRDQWMSEGFAEFSASLFAQLTRGNDKFKEFWDDQRQLIIQARPQTHDRKPYTVGPVTQGYRLNSGKTGGVARFSIYPKGAFILHMLRQMMFDSHHGGDQRFMEMMQDFIKTNYNKDVSTEDFKAAVERHMTKEMDIEGNGRMDWFFDEWVYGTEIPTYRFEYEINGNNFTGRVTQSGVSDHFSMRVPVYLDFGKGWVRLGSANITGNHTVELPNIPLPQAPHKAAIAALDDVLALNVENVKK